MSWLLSSAFVERVWISHSFYKDFMKHQVLHNNQKDKFGLEICLFH